MFPLPWIMASMVTQFWLDTLSPPRKAEDQTMSDSQDSRKPAKPKFVIPATAHPVKPAYDFHGLLAEITALGFRPVGSGDPSRQWDNRARALRNRSK